MAADISPTTGQLYYSGSWTAIQDICKVLKIGPGKLSQIDQPMVNRFQEMVDREIDGMLTDLYWVPLRRFNQYQPDGSTKSVMNGNIQRLARYWTAGLMLQSQFQQLDPNVNETTTSYIEDSRKEVYDIVRFQRRLQGQEMKHPLKTAPPSLMPPYSMEQNW